MREWGFFGRLTARIKSFLKWGDEVTEGHSREDIKKQEQPGGTEFTDPDVGVGHSGHTSKNADPKTVKNASRLVGLAGVWGTSPSAMWGNWKDLFDNFMNAYNLEVDATAELNGVIKEYTKTDTTDWFMNELKNGANLRTIPKDSLPYYHLKTYKTPEGYYGNALSN